MDRPDYLLDSLERLEELRLLANSLRDGIRTGDALLAELVSRLGIDADAEPDSDATYF